MEDRFYLINLFDIYGELLTEKQQNYFQEYYFNNLSLTEIAENNQVSRNAIHKHIKESINNLTNYEEILKLFNKNKKILKLISNIDEKVKQQIIDIL
ncbi:MAG: YlxM family DNA-binding protein [Bacilli bacterium]